jgi:hypothetical protein
VLSKAAGSTAILCMLWANCIMQLLKINGLADYMTAKWFSKDLMRTFRIKTEVFTVEEMEMDLLSLNWQILKTLGVAIMDFGRIMATRGA